MQMSVNTKASQNMLETLNTLIKRLNYQPFVFVTAVLVLIGIVSPGSFQNIAFDGLVFVVAALAIYAYIITNKNEVMEDDKSPSAGINNKGTFVNQDIEMRERLCYFEWVRVLPSVAWSVLITNLLDNAVINVDTNNRAECIRYLKNRGQLESLRTYLEDNHRLEKPACIDSLP